MSRLSTFRVPSGPVPALTLLLAALPTGAVAQSPRDVIRELIPGSTSTEISAVASSVVLQIASVPIGSSSGAFSYVQNTETGESMLKAFGFGPSFAERPTTLGKAGAFTFGTSFQRTTFRTFEGVNLRGGLTAEVRLDGQPVGQLFTASIDFSTATTSFLATAGVTKDLDVSVSVPWVRLSLAGMRTSGLGSAPGAGTIVREAETAGIGDIMVRAKWAPWQTERGAIAAAYEARLPTGSREQLIGLDGVRSKLLFLGSTTAGIVSPHVNLSYQFGGDGAVVRSVPDGIDELVEARVGTEIGYTVGLEIAAHSNLTLSVDVLGRSLRRAARFEYGERSLGATQGTPDVRATLAQLSQLRTPEHLLAQPAGRYAESLAAGGRGEDRRLRARTGAARRAGVAERRRAEAGADHRPRHGVHLLTRRGLPGRAPPFAVRAPGCVTA